MIIQKLEDAERFQQMIKRLWEWAKTWEMSFNVAKCKILHFGQKNPKYEYEMGGLKIQEAEEEKRLGRMDQHDPKTDQAV